MDAGGDGDDAAMRVADGPVVSGVCVCVCVHACGPCHRHVGTYVCARKVDNKKSLCRRERHNVGGKGEQLLTRYFR